MRRMLYLGIVAAGLLPAASSAQQICIDFLQSAELLKGPINDCGSYVNPIDPGPADAYAVQFSVPHGAASQGWIYYTTDGSAPEGALGVPSGTTQVAAAAPGCTFGLGSDQSDALKGSIPVQPLNTHVTFVLSARAALAPAQESFLGTGDGTCSCSQAGCAQPFTYTVARASPRPVDDVILVLQDTPRSLSGRGVMANDRYVSEGVTAELEDQGTVGELSFQSDGSLVYTPAPGYIGDESIQYRLLAGEVHSSWAQITFKVRAAPALAAVSPVSAGESCPTGGQRIDTGHDDGSGGGTYFDGILQPGEVTATRYVCNGASGTGGAAGEPGKLALVAVGKEPAGANCAAGGQKIQVGVDANANGVLEEGEVTSTSFACDGLRGKSGCSAAPGTVSLLGAMASLASLGAMRRRRAVVRSSAAVAKGENR
jgi:hypothetical protein